MSQIEHSDPVNAQILVITKAEVAADTEPPSFARPRVVERKFIAPVEDVSSADSGRMRWVPGAPAVSPVTAYAPVHDPARAITTGRGLY